MQDNQGSPSIASTLDKVQGATPPPPQPLSPLGPAPVEDMMPPRQSRSGLFKRLAGETRAYLAEYAVQLILLGTLIALVNTFFSGIINSFGEQGEGSWLSSWQYKLSLGQLAAVVAIVPLLALLTRRTSGTEDEAPVVKESSWRKAFLGVFLISVGLTAVGYTIGFVYVLISLAANAGLAVDAVKSPLITLVTTAFGAILFGVSALLYARDYRPNGGALLWRRLHRYGLVALAVVLAVVFMAIPLQKQRGSYVDSLIVGDLQTIRSKISSYSIQKRELPKSLSDVELTDETKKRVSSLKYEYKPASSGGSYELCATFKTDASKKKENNFATALSSLSSGSANTTTSSSESPSTHKKGHQCFKQTASGVRSSSSSSSSRLNSLDRGSDSYDDLFGSSYDDFDYGDSEL